MSEPYDVIRVALNDVTVVIALKKYAKYKIGKKKKSSYEEL